MRDLLERWAQLEPERCARRSDVESEKYPVVVDLRNGNFGLTIAAPVDGHERSYVLGATIEAITERGWWWRLGSFGTNPEIRAYVGPPDPSYAPRPCSGDSPAEALLVAYLSALEAA